MPRLSIMIPWWDENPALEDTLVSVLQHRPDDCQILVLHNRAYGDPWRLAGEIQFHQSVATSEVGLINAGLERSAAKVVHILRCGIEVVEGWTERPVERFERDADVASVAPLIVDRTDSAIIAAAGIGLGFGRGRRVLGAGHQASRGIDDLSDPLGPTLSAAFYRRESLDAIGGFDPGVGAHSADLDVALTLGKRGWKSVLEPASLVRGPRESRQPVGYAVGRGTERCYWRHASGQGLAAIISHLAAVTARYVTHPSYACVPDLIGRCLGFLERRKSIDRSRGRSPSRTTVPFDPHACLAERDDGRESAPRRAA